MLALVAILVPLTSTRAQTWQAEHLRGLDSIRVVVEDFDKDAQAAGLDSSVIETKVKLLLRQYGIPLTASSGKPYLYVSVIVATREESGLCYWATTVELNEWHRVRGQSFFSTVWGETSIGSQGCRYAAHETIWSRHLQPKVESFINDYLSVNPRQ